MTDDDEQSRMVNKVYRSVLYAGTQTLIQTRPRRRRCCRRVRRGTTDTDGRHVLSHMNLIIEGRKLMRDTMRTPCPPSLVEIMPQEEHQEDDKHDERDRRVFFWHRLYLFERATNKHAACALEIREVPPARSVLRGCPVRPVYVCAVIAYFIYSRT